MSESTDLIIEADMQNNCSVQSWSNPGDKKFFDLYETGLDEYLSYLVQMYMDWQILYNVGIVRSLDFMPKSMHDVYHIICTACRGTTRMITCLKT